MKTAVTLNDIRLLRDVAAIHGDCAQVRICERALNGSKRAIAECRRVIHAARVAV